MAPSERQEVAVAVKGANYDSSQVKSLADLMVQVIQSPVVGLNAVELAGALIAENARFNQWVHERKERSTTSEMWNISALANRNHSDCLSAWQTFLASPDREEDLDSFLAVLTATLAGMKKIRESDRVDFDDPSMPQVLRDWL